jgi:hypothetical protein
MSNLLCIDWDYFFPNPMDGGSPKGRETLLYDWGHLESQFMIEMMWPTRATGFVGNGLDLPGMLPGWRTFLDRFRFSDDVCSYVSESNSDAGNLTADGRPFDSVWLFDAHHDSGYTGATVEEWLKTGMLSCEDWMVWHHVAGSDLHVRYPKWKVGWAHEPEPMVSVDRQVDDEEPMHDVVFDAVHLCRSGAWVPSWCDDEFFQFVEMLPGDLEEIGSYPLKRREFDLAEVEELITQRDDAVAQLKEASSRETSL